MFHSLSLVEKWSSYYENNSKNYYYQKNYFIFKLPIFGHFFVKGVDVENVRKNRKLKKKFKEKLKNAKFLFLMILKGALYMGNGRKKYPKFRTKNWFLTIYPGTPPHGPLNHSKSCREFIFVDPVQLWGQTVIIWIMKNN